MSYQREITTNEELNHDKFSMTNRLSPIGSASSDTEYDRRSCFNEECNENIALLEEHEKLNAALAALTRHVAHVQFRLEQVLSAPTPEDRENLLLQLHDFASSGIPDIMWQTSIDKNEQLIEAEKTREKKFIHELKQKLDELEHYAAASGSLERPPTSVTIEKQRVLIDQLCHKLDLQFDDASVSKLSAEELRKLVDQGIHQLTNPVKLKENLITQMRTEIGDLEKFIDFLKTDSTASIRSSSSKTIESSFLTKPKSNSTRTRTTNSLSSERNSSNISQAIKKFLVLTQLYTFLFLSCGTRSIQKKSYQSTSNIKKDPMAKNHFGNLRAQLEIAIEKVLHTINDDAENTTSDSEEENHNSAAIILSIRQDLAPALRALLEHGLHETNHSTSLTIWNCCSTRSTKNFSTTNESMHIWKLFLKYYEMKQGNEFVDSPARQLSQSFSLDIIGGKPITIKQFLLSGIDTVRKLHEKHPKPMDSCFKSFVCYALNEKKLVLFLRMILKTTSLIEIYYEPWSYTKQTDFNDALHSLDRLTSIDFHLPIDISVRRFMNNRDLIQ